MTLRSIARALCASLGLSIAATLVSMTLIAASLASLDSIESLASFRSAAKIVQMSCYLLTGVLFLAWTYRLVRRASNHARSSSLPSARTAVIAYLIPIANFVWPFLILSRINSDAKLFAASRVFHTWWFTWVAANCSAWLITFLTVRSEPPSSDSTLLAWALLPDALFVLCSALAIIVVRRLTPSSRLI